MPRKAKLTQGHDQGISYTEQVISAASSRPHPFFLHRGPAHPPRRRSDKGASVHSLEEMAMRCLLNNLGGLEQESLEGVPEKVVREIWKRILFERLDNIRIWILITTALGPNPPGPRFQVIKNPLTSAPLSLVSSKLLPPTNKFTHLVSLTICDTQYDAGSLLSLSSLTNLVALHIKGPSESKETAMIDDATLRHWSRQASQGGGFENLRWMFLRWQPDVTAQGLTYLTQFPRLEMVSTSRCGIVIKEAKKAIKDSGWTMTKRDFYAHVQKFLDNGNELLHASEPKPVPWIQTVSNYVLKKTRALYNSKAFNGSSNDTNTARDESTKPPPLLDLTLGTNKSTYLKTSLHEIGEVQCYIKMTEEERLKQQQEGGGNVKRRRIREEDAESDPRRRKIRDAKRKELLEMLMDM